MDDTIQGKRFFQLFRNDIEFPWMKIPIGEQFDRIQRNRLASEVHDLH
jgi:hypothetical protein